MSRKSILVSLLVPLATLAGCGDSGEDGTSVTTIGMTSADTGTSDDSASSSVSATTSPTSGVSMTDTATTGVDTSASVDGSSSDGGGCEPTDACMVDGDCQPGQTCVACNCIGDPMGCNEWGEGAFGECLQEDGSIDNTACMGGNMPSCLVNDTMAPTVGVCFFTCETMCDCPMPPAGFEEQVVCANLTTEMPAVNDCYIDCMGPLECPEGMSCFQNTVCMFSNAPMAPLYGDCVNTGLTCEDGVCVSDMPMDPTFGVCVQPCADMADCAAPGSGDAIVACADITGDMMNECLLGCPGGETCPDGMVCNDMFDLCVWEKNAYNDCANAADTVCLGTETCVTDMTGAVCAEDGCMMAMDCAAPLTGDAVPDCGDINMDMMNECHLDCSGGQTCPDGMECLANDYCHWVMN